MTNITTKKKESQPYKELALLEDVIEECDVKKNKNVEFTDLIYRKVEEKKLSENMWNFIRNCNHFMRYYTDKHFEKRKLMQANSCKNRFCPICAWRKAHKDAMKHMIILKKLALDKKYAFLFVTLTAPSVSGERLREELDDYAKAFKRFSETKAFEKINVGYIRKLEITYNENRNDYHPHYHLLICVNKSYFTSKNYIKHEKWLTMWQIAKRDNNITNVDVRKVNSDNAFLEISKYTAKDSEYMKNDDKKGDIFSVLYDSMKGKQAITYNKIFKELNLKYKSGSLDYLKELDETKYVFKVIYKWFKNHYEEIESVELTETELSEIDTVNDEILFLKNITEFFDADVEVKNPLKNVKLGEMKKVSSSGDIED